MLDEIKVINNIDNLKMLGQGNTAEIYQYDEKRILKLFRENMPLDATKNEYRISSIIQKQLSNVPKVYEMVQYENRYGIVYEQVRGNDMLKLLLKKPFKMKKYVKLLASNHAQLHEHDIDVNYSVNDKLKRDIEWVKELSDEEKKKIIAYMNTLPVKHKICHMDFHPGNVMICDNRSVVIDWMTACTGDSNVDVARTMLLMEMGEVIHMKWLLKQVFYITKRVMGKEYIKEYQRLTKVTMSEVNAWILPVAAARLSEWLTNHERAKIVKLVKKKLVELTD